MRDQPISTGACCPKDVSGVTQPKLGDRGHSVDVRGLKAVFEQLLAMGREPDEVSDAELLDMVRAARDYIPAQQETEAKYTVALRRAYAAYFFWGDGCPHCAQAKPFLKDLSRQHPEIEVQDFEVWYVPENRTLFQVMAAAFDFEPHAVPTIFVGERYWERYNEQIGRQIQIYATDCISSGCPDAGRGILTSDEPDVALGRLCENIPTSHQFVEQFRQLAVLR